MIGGRQIINLAGGCSTGSTIHEIGHAVGLYHEQSRNDRDRYITVNFNNIQSGREHNFRTYGQRRSDGDEYTNTLDFNSIMMYHSTAFSKNGRPTITKKDGSSYRTQRGGLSDGDKRGINIMYPGNGGNPNPNPNPNPEPTYENGQYYVVYGLRVYRYNNQWWYYTNRFGWRQVIYRDGNWYYA